MTRRFQRSEVVTLLGVDESFLLQLEEEEIVVAEPDGYADDALERIRFARTLVRDLDVNLPGVVVALQLTKRIETERQQFEDLVHKLRAMLDSSGT